ncbi:hypothetical protein EJ04DRAFT_508606 [Polyplosphaeria fusca]|uniref:Uncharacterized protein n=1 Tax=Polyplosphaeria fusca TaxID=682080 RepID=A0A9P4RAG0_9PLEO|nr:hypothetical protein EJ04DRAFT_508606 [Polyplosphaeria fusca]
MPWRLRPARAPSRAPQVPPPRTLGVPPAIASSEKITSSPPAPPLADARLPSQSGERADRVSQYRAALVHAQPIDAPLPPIDCPISLRRCLPGWPADILYRGCCAPVELDSATL